MKYLFLTLLLSACAQTSITSKNLTMKTQADIKKMVVNADGSWSVEEMNHSVPTVAGGNAISKGANAFGTAATGFATATFFHIK